MTATPTTNVMTPGPSGRRRRRDRARRRAGALRARLASWRSNHRTAPAQLELTVGEHRWLNIEACVSTIDGAAVVEIDTIALDSARRCRVYVNDGPVYNAVPDDGDHDTVHLAPYLEELRRQELISLNQAAAAARIRVTDLPEWRYEEVAPADIGRDWPLITLDEVRRWSGTMLTEDEIDRLIAAIPNSAIPEVIGDLVAAITARDADH
ncbi:hypothetical protein ACIGO9_31850 [Nocardia asteroides]|uniref:hypothetical protein n=1 Tax=Nocardia asteroides TaxID=1824 RepID=UPI0037CB716E